MAGSRKSKGDDGLQAQPDSTVRWSKAMREALAQFKDHPCRNCGGTLSGERSLADSLDFFRRHHLSSWQRREARLRMLELHGLDAVELFLLDPAPRKEAAADLLAIHDAAVVRFLVTQVKHLDCKNALIKQAARWPLFVLCELLSANPARHQAGAALVLELLAANPEWQAPLEAACDAAQRKTLERLQEDSSEGLADAAPDEWPAFLRHPPWKNRQALPTIPTLALQPVSEPAVLHWDDFVPASHVQVEGNISDWLKQEASSRRKDSDKLMEDFGRTQSVTPIPAQVQGWDNPRKALWLVGVRPESVEAVLNGRRIEPEDFAEPSAGTWGHTDLLWQLPAPVAMAAFEHMPQERHYLGEATRLRPVLYHFGPAALPGLLPYLKQGARAMFELVSVIEWDQLANWVAKGFHTNRWVRREAGEWLSRYPDTAARGLIPAALGEAGAPRDTAQAALRWLQTAGHADKVRAQAVAYGPEAVEAITQLLSIAPEDLLPDSLPAVPKALPLTTLPRLVLKDSGHALPQAAVPDVLMAMMLSKSDAPYPGLTSLLAVLTPDSFARFGRALLAWWIGNGRPSKERWAFALQGRFGDDETARQLFGLLRQWRAALDRVRAYDALAMLGEIGSDAALMHLSELARQTRYDDLRSRADRMLVDVAEQRGLSLEQLADRTVPDLGLDARARLSLDFGARSFEVRMDDNFQPVLRDSAGKLLKALPKPNASDDTGKAAAATTQLKELRKLAKTVASAQLKRLEAAMCEQRRWAVDEFVPFFANHPVLRVFSRPLVWGLFDAQDQLAGAFRVSAEGELTDLQDDAFELPEDGRVGIPHPLEIAALDPALARAWASVLADYELVQPFEQLMRETFTLDEAQRSRRALDHWAGRPVSNAGLLGLETRGWQREVGDGGMVNSFNKPLPGGRRICLQLEEGWFVQDSPDAKVLQTVSAVVLDSTDATLGKLTPIVLSEIERDLNRVIRAAAP
ncbi:DUF4132 domain-containing protein [Variovorax sp. PAMC26660]|uniref:DUF4132 domain-containing protein n=1 Tax=Variovorax sp. PAMC26660 TaxID=2762322 RepID=UPI00164D4F37|nr:DUF4132 domain-containing protein [Variovorax sp. PAMC26660]QNK70287.1 DUF4132 domain-containing protein [Variovorax sp. PAMC26660]